MKKTLKELGFKEEIEEESNIVSPGSLSINGDYVYTGWPKPEKRYKLVYESPKASLEETYFWILTHLKVDQGYHEIIKITDNFAASENSSFWGQQQQRLGAQQDKVSSYLALIGKMTKELFQIVREVRILKERLQYYYESKEGIKSADIALKGYWVDLVEGGGNNAQSVFGLAQKLNFITLPDLFFNTFVPFGGNVDEEVEKQAGNFNKKVKEVLKRKLYQFVTWRENTMKELENRHIYTLRYLRQHWNAIRLYISWVKPYLKNISRLKTESKHLDDPELISSMETAIIEIEFLAKRHPIKNVHPVILAHFHFRVRPEMNFTQQDYYNKGAIHSGRITVTLRAYAWTKEEINNYIRYREEEDIELLTFIDKSIKDAMDSLGDDLKNFLKEAEEEAGIVDSITNKKENKKTKENKPPSMSLLEPFRALFDFNFFKISNKKEKVSINRKGASKSAVAQLYQVYKNYKKSHGMLAW